jgi:type I thyroxine 5'-deiodinase
MNQPTAFKERWEAAQLCAEQLGLSIPTVVDGMDDAACEAFSAWPERMYIVNGGRIHYRGGQGPYDFDVPGARASLLELLGD